MHGRQSDRSLVRGARFFFCEVSTIVPVFDSGQKFRVVVSQDRNLLTHANVDVARVMAHLKAGLRQMDEGKWEKKHTLLTSALLKSLMVVLRERGTMAKALLPLDCDSSRSVPRPPTKRREFSLKAGEIPG
jgi:hypothetical protein